MSANDLFASKLAQLTQQVKQAEQQDELEKNAIVQMHEYFGRNMAALAKYFPRLAEFFRTYQLRSLRLFVTPTGQINVYDKETGHPLYGDDPSGQSDQHVENFLKNPVITHARYQKRQDNHGSIHSLYVNQMIDVEADMEVGTTDEDKVPDFIGTLFIAGCGLGYALPAFYSRVEVQLTILTEPDPDMFYASLHVIDWAGILDFLDENNHSIYINVGSNAEVVGKDMYNYLRYHSLAGICGAFIYEHAPSAAVTAITEGLRKQFSHYVGGWGFFDDAIHGLSHFYANLTVDNAPALLTRGQYQAPLHERTAMVVGNGPSLDHALPVIKKYREQLVLISCGSASTALYKAGIVPDFHAEIERLQLTYTRLAQLPADYLSQITLLAGNVLHPKCASLFNSVIYGLKANEAATTFFHHAVADPQQFPELSYCNPMSANAGAAFAAAMGFGSVVLAGVDCGFVEEGYHHSRQSAYYTDDGSAKPHTFNLTGGNHFPIKGNLRDTIRTTVLMDYSRYSLAELAPHYPQTTFINLSDGAFISGMQPLEPEQFEPAQQQPVTADEIANIIAACSAPAPALQPEELKEKLDIPAYQTLINFMVGKLQAPLDSQEQVIMTLESMQTAINQYRSSHPHIFNCLEGTFAYFMAFTRQVMYLSKKEAELALVRRLADIFILYLQDSLRLFELSFEHVDQVELDMSAFKPS